MPEEVHERPVQPVSGSEIQQLVGLFSAGRYADLEAKARELTVRDPTSGIAWKVLGASLGMQGKDALAALQEASRRLPQDAESHNNLGNALRGRGQLDAAVASCRRALELKPDFAEAHNNLGSALLGLGQVDEAIVSCRRALELKPDFAEAHNNLGNALLGLDQLPEAVDSYRRALQIRPQYAEAHNNLGNALLEFDQPQEAVLSCRHALELKPQYAEAHSNLGNALLRLGQVDEALVSCRRALELKPDFAEAHNNLGNALMELGQLDKGLANFDRAIALKPSFPTVRLNRSLLLLLRGDFDEGWADYESRWRGYARLRKDARHFVQPRWQGEESIAGKTLLLYGEQGLGDTLQFCRYVKAVADRGASVVLEVQKRLVSLLTSLPGVSQIVARGSALPHFDYQCPLMSLPLAFKTNLSTIPSSARYLTADATRVTQWRRKLGTVTTARVGLAWCGNPKNRNDYKRSILLSDLVRHLPAGLQYVSLHKDVSKVNGQLLQSSGILQFSYDMDFPGSAALCECLDLVISVDTSLAHLSGALGRNTWVLLPWVPDWRWLLDRDDSPWYPSVRLYRQRHRGDWSSILERINADLIHRLCKTRPSVS